jgi:ferredoxin
MDTIVTDKKKCIQCMACVAACPNGARILPPSFTEKIEQMLAPVKDIRKENETFI